MTHRVTTFVVLVLGSTPSALLAAVPHEFQQGTPALASQVNENFRAIDITPPDIVKLEKTRDDGVLLIDLSISDDDELEKVIVSGDGYFAADSSLIDLDNLGTYLIGPDVSDISARLALLPSSDEGRKILHVTDMSGNTSKFWKTAPVASPQKIQSGVYHLEQPISTPACMNFQQSVIVETLTVSTSTYYRVGHGNFGDSDLRIAGEGESHGSSGGSYFPELPAGTFETCPAETEQDYSSDPDYALIGPSVFSVNVSAYPVSFSYQGPVADQDEYCSNVKGDSRRNSTYTYAGGTIQPLGDGSITVEFRTACKVGDEIEKNVFSVTGRRVSQ